MAELRDEQVRTLHVATMGLAILLVLVALLLLGGPSDGGARLLVILVLLALLGVQVWLFLQDRKALQAAEAQGWQPAGQGADVAPTPPPPPGEAAKMVIRCKQCGQVFPVHDTGARPLVAVCPHCGKSGTIKVKQG